MSKDINTIETSEKIVENDVFEQFSNIIESLSCFRTQINGIQQQVKHLEKNIKKQMKGLKKDIIKNKNKGNRKPSGFAKPSKVTKELCEFMNKTEGTEIARTEVTRALVSYIKSNKLENENNSKIKCKFLIYRLEKILLKFKLVSFDKLH